MVRERIRKIMGNEQCKQKKRKIKSKKKERELIKLILGHISKKVSSLRKLVAVKKDGRVSISNGEE